MSIVYELIANLNFTQGEKTSLRTFFTNNPYKRAEAEIIIPTCSDVEAIDYLKELLNIGMFSQIQLKYKIMC